jgi:hypothetical protein
MTDHPEEREGRGWPVVESIEDGEAANLIEDRRGAYMGGKCVEVPNAENVELAVLAVEDVLRRAKELEALYDSAFGGQ